MKQRHIRRHNLIQPIRFKHVIGFLVITVTVLGHVLLFFKEIPEENVATIHHSMGILDSASMLILSYYYGSSSGSKAKSKVIEDRLKDATEEAAA